MTLILLVLTTSLTIMSLDLYAPSLPYLPEYFSTSTEMVKMTVSLNAFMYGIGTLVYGPLSERFGRRPILVGAIGFAALSSLFCTLAVSIEQLIVAPNPAGVGPGCRGSSRLFDNQRLFQWQGQGSCVCDLGRCLRGNAHIFADTGRIYFCCVWLAGKFCIIDFHCRHIDTLLLWKYLAETGSSETRVVSIKQTGRDYVQVLRSRAFLSFAVIQATGVGYFVVFPTAVPFILANQFDKAPGVLRILSRRHYRYVYPWYPWPRGGW